MPTSQTGLDQLNRMYRYALNHARLGWTFQRTYNYVRENFDKTSSADVHVAVTAAFAGKSMAQWVDVNRGEVFNRAWMTAPKTDYTPGMRYSDEQLRSVFPQIVKPPYELQFINYNEGYNQSHFQQYTTEVYEDDKVKVMYDDIAKQLRADYKLTGEVKVVFRTGFVIGFVQSPRRTA